MTRKPRVPDDCALPNEVNGWIHTPESNKNGHVWYAPDQSASVGVFASMGRVRVDVLDDRVDGFARNQRVFEAEYDTSRAPDDLLREAIDRATDWMARTDPDDWEHPAVEPAVFDAPVGYELERYFLEDREHIVYYRREDAESAVKMAGGRAPETEPSIDTRAYLYVQAWRGSGNATIALAPWTRADDEELHEVVDPPAECGLAVAVKLAREWVREQTGAVRDDPATGQADLGRWSG